MKRSRILPLVFGLLAALGMAVPAQAAEPRTVDVWICSTFQDGKFLVPRRTDINLQISWGSRTRRQGLEFLISVRPNVKIDGVKIEHPNRYWHLPVQAGDFWNTVWTYPAGQLRGGESFVVEMQVVFREPVFDGDIWYEAGKQFEPPLACKVKAPRG